MVGEVVAPTLCAIVDLFFWISEDQVTLKITIVSKQCHSWISGALVFFMYQMHYTFSDYHYYVVKMSYMINNLN